MSGPAWRVRPYRSGDERALVALWTAAFGRPLSEAHWRWKFQGRPAPIDNVVIAVDADDRPISQFAAMPGPALVQGVARTVMVGADVMTAAEYRRRGLFTATARYALERWAAAGVALCYGLPNDYQWGSREGALGYERYFALRWLVRPIRLERVLARRSGMAALARLRVLGRVWNRIWDRTTQDERSVEIRPVIAATPEFDAVWRQVAPRLTTSLIRDRAWVAWRYDAFPDRAYQLTLALRGGVPAGFGVHRVETRDGLTTVQVPEIFAPGDATVQRALVREVIARATAVDADTVVTLAVPGSESYDLFRRLGFMRGAGGWPVNVQRLDRSIPSAAVRDPRRWWLAGGDFDAL